MPSSVHQIVTYLCHIDNFLVKFLSGGLVTVLQREMVVPQKGQSTIRFRRKCTHFTLYNNEKFLKE